MTHKNGPPLPQLLLTKRRNDQVDALLRIGEQLDSFERYTYFFSFFIQASLCHCFKLLKIIV